MNAYIHFGTSPGPFQTVKADDLEFRGDAVVVKLFGRWRKVRRVRGFDYVTVDGQPQRVCFA